MSSRQHGWGYQAPNGRHRALRRPQPCNCGRRRSPNAKEPICIFSNPTAIVHSAKPPLIKLRARRRELEPVEQLLFTL
jgi:hypothetical protein